jgi:glycosyltransferase involved in cell wall biosynthesis
VRIGMTFAAEPTQTSVRWVGRMLMDTVAAEHEMVRLPPDFAYCADSEREALAESFVQSCDLLVGQLDREVARARYRSRSSVPYVIHFLGALSRGAFNVPQEIPILNTNDVFIVNCTADQELAQKFIENADVQLVPFAVDHGAYYPLSGEERRTFRAQLGFDDDDCVLLYAGRITLEKNLHTVFRVFRALLSVVPNAYLVLAGEIYSTPFVEFGVVPVDFTRTIAKTAVKLGLPRDRVRFCGQTDPDELRHLYGAADIKINLTLHHDENFGMSQLEAMACGTPVVGTAWGGLKDTIVDGITGFHISTAPTLCGVKVNWWEAVNKLVALLRDRRLRARMGEACIHRATTCYSATAYRVAMKDILIRAAHGSKRPAESLRVTKFANEFWTVCSPESDDQAPYRRGGRSRELYQELMRPYTGCSKETVPLTEDFRDDHVLCLASPIVTDADGGVRIDDPVFPLRLDPPQDQAEISAAILTVLQGHPVIRVDDLRDKCPSYSNAMFRKTLSWMTALGVILRTQCVDDWIEPRQIDPASAEPVFSVQEVDRTTTDLVVY